MNEMLKLAMSSWVSLNQMISSFTESELKEMLEIEKNGKKRKMFLERIHQRYCTVRATRERQELLA